MLANKAKLFTGTQFNVGKQTYKTPLCEGSKYFNLDRKLQVMFSGSQIIRTVAKCPNLEDLAT